MFGGDLQGRPFGEGLGEIVFHAERHAHLLVRQLNRSRTGRIQQGHLVCAAARRIGYGLSRAVQQLARHGAECELCVLCRCARAQSVNPHPTRGGAGGYATARVHCAHWPRDGATSDEVAGE